MSLKPFGASLFLESRGTDERRTSFLFGLRLTAETERDGKPRPDVMDFSCTSILELSRHLTLYYQTHSPPLMTTIRARGRFSIV